jgi:hypothetical protein
LDRARRKRSGVFLKAEPFLLGRSNQFAVYKDGGSGVMALRNAVFGWPKPRPVFLFKPHGIF